ncbi:hypothetical protein IHE45_08G099300 [Dioscorea alata]|uniref:Uncharacterized protein n=1 Tax=Dioscorea alata TaxID=55571 RepID=A0ACB7VLB5_DIOAL|nr:hypothetical protein IHE45_08G099300 [Dioscorea alata]
MRSESSFDAWTKPTTSPLSQPEVHHQQKAHSAGWHSPVPYLFGGLAAMLGLIAFALLILACSYWKLSGYLDSTENTTHDEDQEMANMKQEMIKTVTQQCSEVRLVVIMAGEEKPTFLATPINSSHAASSSSSSSSSSYSGGGKLSKNEMEVKEERMESSDQRVEP